MCSPLRVIGTALFFIFAVASCRSEQTTGVSGPPGSAPSDDETDTNSTTVATSPSSREVAPPRGFKLELVAEGFEQAVAFAFASGDQLFVAEKRGVVQVVRAGKLLPEPFLDLSREVNDHTDRGLLAIAVHPAFPTAPYVYLFYTYDPPETATLTGMAGLDGAGARVARLVRVEADATTDYVRARPGSERVLVGASSTFENIPRPDARNEYEHPTCGTRGSYVADCIPADELSHTVGALRFGADGALYASYGDGCDFARSQSACTRALDVDSFAGKILRIDPSSGMGLPDNPLAELDLSSNRSKVFASGFRNPFRFTFDSADSSLYVGDVGWNSWEEVNHVAAGANFGWPCHEGGSGTTLAQPAYSELPRCRELAEGGDYVTPPVYAYAHRSENPESGSAIVLGDFYRGAVYPPLYRGSLFYADFNLRELRFLTFDKERKVASSQVFLETRDYIVQLSSHPEKHDLYVLSMSFGESAPTSRLERLSFRGYGAGPAANYPYRVSSVGDLCMEVEQAKAAAPALTGCHSAASQEFMLEAVGAESFRLVHTQSGLALAVEGDRVLLEEATHVSEAQQLRLWPLGDAYQLITQGERCLAVESPPSALIVDDCSSSPVQLFRLIARENRPPKLTSISDQLGIVGLDVSLQIEASDPENAELTFFAEGLPAGTSMDPQTGWVLGALTVAGTYVVRVRVTDGQLEHARTFLWTVRDDTLPDVVIDAPSEARRYVVGERIEFLARAFDHTGQPVSPEHLRWELLSHHNQHVHPNIMPSVSGPSGSFVVSDHGDNTALELCVTAIDVQGRRGRACRLLRPRVVEYTVDSVPPGLTIPWAGVPRVTPYTVEASIGGTRDLIAPLSQEGLRFVSWTDGLPASHTIVVGEEPRRVTAFYAAPQSTP